MWCLASSRALLLDDEAAGPEDLIRGREVLLDDAVARLGLDAGLGRVVHAAGDVAVGVGDPARAERAQQIHQGGLLAWAMTGRGADFRTPSMRLHHAGAACTSGGSQIRVPWSLRGPITHGCYPQMSVGSAREMDSSVMAMVARSRPRRDSTAAPGTMAATDPANRGTQQPVVRLDVPEGRGAQQVPDDRGRGHEHPSEERRADGHPWLEARQDEQLDADRPPARARDARREPRHEPDAADPCRGHVIGLAGCCPGRPSGAWPGPRRQRQR